MASLNIRMDDTVQKEVEGILSSLGLTPSTAVRIFYQQIINHKGLPFDLRLDVPNARTLSALKEAQGLVKDASGEKRYSSGKDALAAALSDDEADECILRPIGF